MSATNDPLLLHELWRVREIHAQRSEERQRFSLSVMLAGSGVIAAMLVAAESLQIPGQSASVQQQIVTTSGHVAGPVLHWLLPFLVLGVWSFDIRFRVCSARAEELMQRIYDEQLESLIGVRLCPELQEFRDSNAQYYSQHKRKFTISTQLVQCVSQLPLGLIFCWSIVSVVVLQRVPRLWPDPGKMVGISIDHLVWSIALGSIAVAVAAIRLWRRRKMWKAFRELGDIRARIVIAGGSPKEP